ncbi:alginate O-acetyltransferase AlgX-related protein [Tropicimonas aquimaris]|uniref:AlgX/AlgJ SGNH hydrolase-like domain-containing protein n=1 Tax=Tropicimonas aquimaris TaxID=914152 RepID=A0ABW3IKC6_9RHOB
MPWNNLRTGLGALCLCACALPAAAAQGPDAPEAAPDPAAALYPSQFGCSGLPEVAQTPVIEGRDGVFYRVYADIRMHHPFSDKTIELLARLSRTLQDQGTTLVFLPIPTKSQAMPGRLPEFARHYGYKTDVSAAVYQDIVDRLRAAGVVTIHGQNAMLAAEAGAMPYFQADFHWSSEGARLAAVELAREIDRLPQAADLERSEFETRQTGTQVAFSGLRQLIQRNCLHQVPEPVTATWKTEKSTLDLGLGGEDDGDGDGGGLDLFGDDESRVQVAVVGTSFSDMALANFDGWISQYTGLDVVNYAITGGNQFGSILSYLTSEDFARDRPHVLVWENPIYNNLLQYGDQPLLELIAAAGGACARPLDTRRTGPDRIEARLDGTDLAPGDVIFADAGGEGPVSAEFHFAFDDGSARVQLLERGERLRHTGRFYMPVNAYPTDRLAAVSVTFDRPVPEGASLALCAN